MHPTSIPPIRSARRGCGDVLGKQKRKKMKKLNLYLILSVLLSIQMRVNAQQITDNGNQWNITIYSFGPNTSSHSLRIGTDTLIGNTFYKAVQTKNDTTSNNWTTINHIREDSLNRVYLRFGDDEKMQYDFNLLVGDTFDVEPNCRLVVSEIDSLEMNNGEKRKRMRLIPIDGMVGIDYTFWIEGIGSEHGLLVEHDRALCSTDYGYSLTCFLKNDEVLYPQFFGECWIETTSIEELNKNIIKVFPNPFKDKLIVSQLQEINLKNVSIFSSLGSKIKEINISNENIEIDTSTLENGVYFLRFISKEGKVYSKKIIK